MLESDHVPDSPTPTLSARDSFSAAALAHRDSMEASDAADEVQGVADRLADADEVPEPAQEDSPLTVSLLAAARVASATGASPGELADVLERMTVTLDASGWAGMQAVHELQ